MQILGYSVYGLSKRIGAGII